MHNTLFKEEFQMRIQHNISALNTHRNLAFNNTQTSKALEKLSSGYKINRAGDDAAGLAISEKMRGQIRGLDMASKNAQDGISLIQTAEGALNETHSILQRMRELAVQAGNDTNTTQDREEIQKEINQLTSEINRIGNTTEFNTKKLVNGDLSDKFVTAKGDPGTEVSKDFAKTQTATVGTNPTTWATGKQLDTKTDITFTGKASNDMDWAALDATKTNTLTVTKDATSGEMKVTVQAEAGAKTLNIDAKAMAFDADKKEYTFDQDGIKFTLTADQVNNWKDGETATVDLNRGATTGTVNATASAIDLADETTPLGAVTGGTAAINDFKVDGASKELLAGVAKAEISFTGGKVTVDLQDKDGNSINKSDYSAAAGTKFNYNENGISFELDLGAGLTDLAATTVELKMETKTTTVGATSDTTEDRSLKFQIGANENQALSVSVSDMRAAALGIVGGAGAKGFTTENEVNNGTDATMVESALDVSTHDNAANAVTVLDKAINKVSSERAKLGAVQNRLEHTINNLGASSENLTAAESRIRDTDMAASMMEFTKNNILTQAAQSMLAQANQQPQGVLQLLG